MDWLAVIATIGWTIALLLFGLFLMSQFTDRLDVLPSAEEYERRTLPEAPKKKVTIREHWEDGTSWDEEYLFFDFQDPLQELRHVYGVAGYVHRRDGNAIRYGRIKSIELIKQEELKDA